jgi:serine protease Do
LRDGEQKSLRATATERPALLAAAGPDGAPEASADTGALAGVTFGDLSPEQRRRLNVPARVEGALVTGVAPDSAAAKAGIRPGDLVLEINRQPVRSAEDAAAVIVAGSDARTLLRLYSRGNSRYVVVDEREAAQ